VVIKGREKGSIFVDKSGTEFTVIQETLLLGGKEFDGRGVLLVSRFQNVFEDFLRVINQKKTLQSWKTLANDEETSCYLFCRG
jgi:hypothetical protein